MAHHLDIQRNAQAEIDKVVGRDRLPNYSDRVLLPYVEALYKEVLRWHPVAPLGVPHCLYPEKDDNYRGEPEPAQKLDERDLQYLWSIGMFIPKGSTVIANIRCVTLVSPAIPPQVNQDQPVEA